MSVKELREKYNNKTLGEIRGIYSEKLRISILNKESIREDALKLAELNFDAKNYADKAKNLINDIAFYKSHIKDDEKELSIIKPILDKKESEGINEKEYNEYIANNINIKVLIDAVNKDKQEFINSGCKVTLYKNKKPIEITLTVNEVNNIYNSMLKELVLILKDNIGNIQKVEYLKSNSNRGMDGRFSGDRGTIDINTILAGGYNIQKLHYRTLVYKHPEIIV